MRSFIAPLALTAVACVGINPDWDDEAMAGSTVASTAPAHDDSGPTGTGTDGDAPGGSGATEGGSVTSTASANSMGGSGGGDSGTSSRGDPGTTTRVAGSSDGPRSTDGRGTAGPGTVDVGFPCTEDSECDPATGASCCTANQCAGYCFVPCAGNGDCVDDGTSCVHEYCLFECDDDDDDCAAWPGFTCQHGGHLCEI